MGFEAQKNVAHGLLCLEESRVTDHPVGLGPRGGYGFSGGRSISAQTREVPGTPGPVSHPGLKPQRPATVATPQAPRRVGWHPAASRGVV